MTTIVARQRGLHSAAGGSSRRDETGTLKVVAGATIGGVEEEDQVTAKSPTEPPTKQPNGSPDGLPGGLPGGLAADETAPRDPVAQRILTMLEACAASRRPMTIKELAEATGLAKSTAHRMCWKLEGLGLLEHSERGFSIGAKMLSIANANPLVNELRSLAIPHLVNLQQLSGASHLAMLADDKAMVVDGVYTKDLRAYTLVGYGMPLHCTAAGKALLARLEPEEREDWLDNHPLRPATPRSVVRPDALRRQLDEAAETGFAVSIEEFQRGIVSVAAGLEVRPGVFAALACVGSSSDKAVLRSAPRVVAAAAQLEQALARRHEMRRRAAQ